MYLLKPNDYGYGYGYRYGYGFGDGGYGFGYRYGYGNGYGYSYGDDFHRDKRGVSYNYPTQHQLTPEHRLFLTAATVLGSL